MTKQREREDPNSCWNKAKDDEMVFVLLGRDIASPVAITAWVSKRIRSGKNQPDDQQITEALAAARAMEAQSK